MYLEDHVALGRGAHDLISQFLRTCRPGPGSHRNPVAHLLSHQLVGRYLEMLPHDVVERTHQPGNQLAVDEIEGRVSDQSLKLAIRQRCVRTHITVTGDAVVGADLEQSLGIDSRETGFVIGVACGQRRIEVDDVDVRDLHEWPNLL